ncbi:hypothetical protein KHM19_19220 [Leptospira borgpetersenii]|nr:hypothetical protein KHM09_19890 [Leptospira borgpetersenii]GIM22739.1 hypothetical protein KHM19_19220 [Leptospira borgpetersenii]GIM26047.1 hypothetical protein KHM25_19720 [Leptospira borgpetersenii]
MQPLEIPTVLQVKSPAACTVIFIIFVNITAGVLLGLNVTDSVTAAGPAAVGIPLIAPVLELMLKPAGRFVAV